MVIWSVAWVDPAKKAAWIYDLSWYFQNLPSSVAFFWPSYNIGIGGDIEGVTLIPHGNFQEYNDYPLAN